MTTPKPAQPSAAERAETVAGIWWDVPRTQVTFEMVSDAIANQIHAAEQAAREPILAERSLCEKCGTVYLFANLGVPCPHCIIRSLEREVARLSAVVNTIDDVTKAARAEGLNKGEEVGRLKGLEEAAKLIESPLGYEWAQVEVAAAIRAIDEGESDG